MQLKVAVKTLNHQPYQKGDKPNGIFSSWPSYDSKNIIVRLIISKKNCHKINTKENFTYAVLG